MIKRSLLPAEEGRKILNLDDDPPNYIEVTNEFTVSKQELRMLECLFLLAGFRQSVPGVWRPFAGEAIVRLFGPNSLKSGSNVLFKIQGYNKNDLIEYYKVHPDPE
mmetsp:Transcript_1824/g.2419  ORF Transcript_1824/g.2419 Transcript_1824/m.2419 type:complete len:106 (+) Transcript_1824:904-1221(+)